MGQCWHLLALFLSDFIILCIYYRYESWSTCCFQCWLSPLLLSHLSTQYFGITSETVWQLQLYWLHAKWMRTMNFFKGHSENFSSTHIVINAAADRSYKFIYSWDTISFYITVYRRASRTVNVYHICTFRHTHFLYGQKALLFRPLHPSHPKAVLENFWQYRSLRCTTHLWL